MKSFGYATRQCPTGHEAISAWANGSDTAEGRSPLPGKRP